MTWGAKAGGLGVSGWLSSAYPGGGILGVDIPTDGEAGGSPAANDGISPTSEYYWRIVTPPASGTLQVFEDLTFIWSADGETGSDSFVYELVEDYASQGTVSITLAVGDDGSASASGNVIADSGSVGGSASGGSASGASGNVTADSGSVGGGASGGSASGASGDVAADSGSVGGAASGAVTNAGTSGTTYVVSATGRRWEIVAGGIDLPESKTATWSAKYPSERVTSRFDFRPDIAYGDAIASVAFVVSNVRGTDPNPVNVLYGMPTVKGGRVFQDLAGGNVDCSYLIECHATTVNGHALALAGVLPVKPF